MLAVGTLLAVFGLLAGRAAAVGTGDVLFFLGLGLHLALFGVAVFTAAPKRDAILQYALEIIVLLCHEVELVVEQAHASEGHGDAVFVAGHDDMVVANRAAGLCDILHATLVGALDIVAEGEEGITA